MDNLLRLTVIIVIGVIGGVGAKKLKFIPAAYMLGALVLSAVWNLTVGFAYFPQELRVATQILAGTYLGLSIDKSNLFSIRTLLKPISLILFLFFINAILFGYLIHIFFNIDLITAFYSFAPGGVAEIAIIADSLGGDAGMITAMQLLRLITAFTFYPFLFQQLEKKGLLPTRRKTEYKQTDEKTPSEKKAISAIDVGMTNKEKAKGTSVALLFSSVGGIIGLYAGIPAGPMVFAMASGVLVNIFYRKAYMPIKMRFIAQIMSGIFLGMRITPESVEGITRAGGPALVMILSMISVPVIIGYMGYIS